jgi:PTH1 family peptidyl-tRNA hydrolase
MGQALNIETKALDKIIIGLGNPGEEYARNRHNVGFMVLDALARQEHVQWSSRSLSRTCRIELGGCPVLLAQPLTYMNQSGKAVHHLLSAFEQNPRNLLVVIDDLDLLLGRIRIRERGSAGGHHGLESILTTLDTEEIVRIRVGIGEEEMPGDKARFVLSDFPPDKQAELNAMIIKAGNAVQSILSDGVARSMAIFNA